MEDWQERRLRDLIDDYKGDFSNLQIERAVRERAGKINPPHIEEAEIIRVLRATGII